MGFQRPSAFGGSRAEPWPYLPNAPLRTPPPALANPDGAHHLGRRVHGDADDPGRSRGTGDRPVRHRGPARARHRIARPRQADPRAIRDLPLPGAARRPRPLHQVGQGNHRADRGNCAEFAAAGRCRAGVRLPDRDPARRDGGGAAEHRGRPGRHDVRADRHQRAEFLARAAAGDGIRGRIALAAGGRRRWDFSFAYSPRSRSACNTRRSLRA